jgi:hypothetical protein
MARHHSHSLSRLTHKFPGEHYLIVRPLRDDLRRSTMETPRRARRNRARRRRKEERVVGKRTTKELKRYTHKGRAAKSNPKSGQAPATMKARQPTRAGNTVIRAGRSAPKANSVNRSVKSRTGTEIHRPRALNPHPPRLYHVLPIRRVYDKAF